ncbi:transposase [Thalassotalea crassostreae]|uniref:transposase n=1 Tax=Thalassotalea crassostreae TaxID=1763536 RepID=UPI00083975BC|nr:transposase [Thalassotalea crassostreae]
MPKPRRQQVVLSETPFYHCTSRCVRRAFLCGKDKASKKSFEHRRAWVEERLLFLSSVYLIDICAFAIMSNHSHVVVKVDVEKAERLSDIEVLYRWHKIHYGTQLTRQYCKNNQIDKHLTSTLGATIKVYRKRLCDLSWFMRDLNEYIARLANEEDKCTGRFWEGRFTSQALLDESALLACMVYCDLNPIRSGLAKTVQNSSYTSVQLRIKSALSGKQPSQLLPFTGGKSLNKTNGICFEINDYIALVETTGLSIRDDKAGYIDKNECNILSDLGIEEENWIEIAQNFESHFKGAVGKEASLNIYVKNTRYKRRPNHKNSQKYFA